jgi:hypothetical protein
MTQSCSVAGGAKIYEKDRDKTATSVQSCRQTHDEKQTDSPTKEEQSGNDFVARIVNIFASSLTSPIEHFVPTRTLNR